METGSDSEEIRLLSKEYVQPIAFAFLLSLVVASLLEKVKVHWVPESLIIIAIGALLGACLQAASAFPTNVLQELSAPVVNLIFLPMIIFESGYSLRQKDFASQFVHILVFACFGTFVAIMVCGILIYVTGDLHGITDRRTAFTFASLISATDPVATLATYSSLKVDPLLNIMVFGESTVNDAVAIVVFDILNSDEIYGPPCDQNMGDESTILEAIALGIINKLVGSIAIGIAFAFAYTLILRIAHMRHSTSMEILFIVFSCYLTFSTAEQVHMSGIIAVLFCGIFMGIYTKPHLSKEGNVLATFFVKELAAWADLGIFLLVGVDIVVTTGATWHFSAWVMLFLLIGRAVAVGLSGLIVNGIKWSMSKKTDKDVLMLSCRHLFMMWHAGLRGGIALVLVLEMGEWVDVRGGEGTKQSLINTTVVVIVVFLFVFGGSTEAMLRCLKIRMGVDVDERYLYDRSLQLCVKNCFEKVDEKVLTPVLVGSEIMRRNEAQDGINTPHNTEVSSRLHHRKKLQRAQGWFVRRPSPNWQTEELPSSSDSDSHASSSQ